jgi:hypothetical protein
MAADRRTPTPGSPTVQPGGTYADAVDEEIASLNNRSVCRLSSVSGSNTITAACTPPLDGYAVPQTYYFIPAGTNTTSVTINIDSRGAKAITDALGNPLVAGSLIAGAVYTISYDGTVFRIVAGPNIQTLAPFPKLSSVAGTTTAYTATDPVGAHLHAKRQLRKQPDAQRHRLGRRSSPER